MWQIEKTSHGEAKDGQRCRQGGTHFFSGVCENPLYVHGVKKNIHKNTLKLFAISFF